MGAWFSLENLAYTAARIAVLLHGPYELRGEKLRQVIHERDHLFGERPIALGLLRNGRSAHRLIIDIVYYQVKAFLACGQ